MSIFRDDFNKEVNILENLEENIEENLEEKEQEKKEIKKVNRKENRLSGGINSATSMSTDFIAKICMLGALSTIIATISMQVWFAPSFYKLEISDSIILLGGFALGPIAVAYMQLIKILLSFFISGTVTAGVGELASFLMGISFAMPATAIYQRKKDFKSAIVGLALGTASLCVVGALLNLYLLIPAYSKGYGLPIEVLVGMGTAVNESITNLNELILYSTIPFNALKALINSVITLALYQKVVPFLLISKR